MYMRVEKYADLTETTDLNKPIAGFAGHRGSIYFSYQIHLCINFDVLSYDVPIPNELVSFISCLVG